jgi:hypothetical protein
VAQGVAEMVGGVGLATGGGLGGAASCPVTVGAGCVVGAEAVIAGSALTAHGATVGALGLGQEVSMLGEAANQLLMAKGKPSGMSGGLGNVGGGKLTAQQALDAAEKWLGKDYKEIAPGVYRSADGRKQFRMTTGDLTDPVQGAHVHFESIDADGRTILENSHVLVDK